MFLFTFSLHISAMYDLNCCFNKIWFEVNWHTLMNQLISWYVYVTMLRLDPHFIISLTGICKNSAALVPWASDSWFCPFLHYVWLCLFPAGTRGFKSCGRGSGSAGTSPTLSPKKTFVPSSQGQLPPSSIALSVTSHYVSPQVSFSFWHMRLSAKFLMLQQLHSFHLHKPLWNHPRH